MQYKCNASANVALKHTINLCLYFYTLTLFSDMIQVDDIIILMLEM